MDDPLLRFKCLNVGEMVKDYIRQSMRSGMKCETLPSDATIVLGQKDNTNSKSLNENTKIYRKVRYEFSGTRQRLHSEPQIEEFLAMLQHRLLPCTSNYDLHSLVWVQIKAKNGMIFNDTAVTYENRIGSFTCPNGKVIFCRHPTDIRSALLKDILNLRPNRGTAPGSALYEKNNKTAKLQQRQKKNDHARKPGDSNAAESKTAPEDSEAEEDNIAAALLAPSYSTARSSSSADPPPQGHIPPQMINSMAMMSRLMIPRNHHAQQGLAMHPAYPPGGSVGAPRQIVPPPTANLPNVIMPSFNHPSQGGPPPNIHLQDHPQQQHLHHAGDKNNPSFFLGSEERTAETRALRDLLPARRGLTVVTLDQDKTIILGQKCKTASPSINLPTKIYRELRREFVRKRFEMHQGMDAFMKELQRRCAEKIPGFPASEKVDCWIHISASKTSPPLDDEHLYDNKIASVVCPNGNIIYCRHPKSAKEAMLKDLLNYHIERPLLSRSKEENNQNGNSPPKDHEADEEDSESNATAKDAPSSPSLQAQPSMLTPVLIGRYAPPRFIPQGYNIPAPQDVFLTQMNYHTATPYFMTAEQANAPDAASAQRTDQATRPGEANAGGATTRKEERRPAIRDVIKPVIRDASINPFAKDPPSQEDCIIRRRDTHATKDNSDSKISFWNEYGSEKWGTTSEKVFLKAKLWADAFMNGDGHNDRSVKKHFGRQFLRDLDQLMIFHASWKERSFESTEHEEDNENFLVQSVYRFHGDMIRRYNKHMRENCLTSTYSNDSGDTREKPTRLEP